MFYSDRKGVDTFPTLVVWRCNSELLIHPRQKEGQESWKYCVERIVLAVEY